MNLVGATLFLILSALLFLADLVLAGYWFVKPKRLKRKNNFSANRNASRHLMIFSLILLGSIWSLRFAIGCSHIEATASVPEMKWYEQVFNSFIHALQTFSMNEAYVDYQELGKKLISAVWTERAVPAFSVYFSVVNFLAPIAGGAFIFEILAGIFPQIHYFVSKCFFWKKRYFFTALNAQAIALAKSIVTNPEEKHIQLIFTDAYADAEKEESAELLLTAKAMGAICLKDDLLHVSLRRLGGNKTFIFISDRSENENLQTFSRLMEYERQKRLKNTEIYVFGSDDKTTSIEDEVTYIHHRLSLAYEEKDQKGIVPLVVPVNGVRNLAQNLFHDLPIFEGLYGKSVDERQVNLTIVGSGTIGTELFLNAYWFGQMTGVRLNINVVSKEEDKAGFQSRIDSINPDIMATARARHPLLKAGLTDDAPDYQPPYFTFRFEKADVLTSELESMMTQGIDDDKFPLRDTDYFIVAAGSDEDNFAIADKLKQAVGNYHIHEAKDKKTIISYVIYNSALCRALNCKPRLKTVPCADSDAFDIYMHAFGSMEDMFSRKNILFDGIQEVAERIGTTYDKSKHDNLRAARTYYNQRAKNSRALHIRYKAFCAGALQPTLFHTKSDKAYIDSLEQAENAYPETVKALQTGRIELPENDQSTAVPLRANADELAWMEHRRWNAFMRINGFRCPDNFEAYRHLDSDIHKQGVDKDYQFLFLKLHPCITECSPESFQLGLDEHGDRQKPVYEKMKVVDKLDELSKKTEQPFKSYDYPEGDL